MAQLGGGLLTSRNLALNLRQHIPSYLKKKTFLAMERQDAARTELGLPLTENDELIKLVQKENPKLLSFDAEMRAAGAEPEPRLQEPKTAHVSEPYIDNKKRNADGRQGGKDPPLAKNPNGAKGGEQLCHRCKKPSHLARNCMGQKADRPPPPPPPRGDNLSKHKTLSHTCEGCKKAGHTSGECWTTHLQLIPKGIQRKKLSAMTAKHNNGRGSY